ncbi:MAG: P-loop NTPase [Methanomicrobiales archaeon]|nr:P-loop NTPase [Methanomicrobiales archaeon]
MVWDKNMVKIAVTGKGGVGKTTIAAGLARTFGSRGYRVIALDMDPSPNLASSLSCSPAEAASITPLVEMEDLILERTGAPPEGGGMVFKINPKVDDIPGRFGIPCRDGVRLLVLGSIRTGGGGCFCPANALARRLVDHLSGAADLLIMDMEAGVEHLGRGTTRTVEALLVVAEPTVKSVDAAGHIAKLARDLGINLIFGVVNKVRGGEGEDFLSRLAALGVTPLGTIPFDPAVQQAEEEGTPVYDLPGSAGIRARIADLADALRERCGLTGPG